MHEYASYSTHDFKANAQHNLHRYVAIIITIKDLVIRLKHKRYGDQT